MNTTTKTILKYFSIVCVSSCAGIAFPAIPSIGDMQQLQQLEQLQGETTLNRELGGQSHLGEPQNANIQTPPVQNVTPPAKPTPTLTSANNNAQDNSITQKDINNSAFQATVRQALPMTPEQIERLRQLFSKAQFAASTLPTTPPKPVATSQVVNLAPGTTPPVIRLAQGFVTSLVFLDSTGAPWPIASYDIGDPKVFNVQWNKTDNTLMVQSNSLYTFGNLAVRLKDLVTPVMITLIPGQQAVDYRVDLRVQGLGPNANPMRMGDGLPPATSPELLGVLDGIPPMGAQRLKLQGGEGQVWLLNDMLYVRTALTILSPAWVSMLASADGMKAYQLQKTPMLLVSDRGKAIQLKIEGL